MKNGGDTPLDLRTRTRKFGLAIVSLTTQLPTRPAAR